MSARRKMIYERINQALSPIFLEVIDESDLHVGHAGHAGGERHFAIHIKSKALNNVSLVEAHRKIYALFTDLMPHQIHALRIKILN